ncbi:MAG: hypothetical protein KA748_10250 [Halomonas sp.]|nr:hypothetical protein [Halomonas sp.]MBP5980577.1 hypothetical protein [Halomonas sp.]
MRHPREAALAARASAPNPGSAMRCSRGCAGAYHALHEYRAKLEPGKKRSAW